MFLYTEGIVQLIRVPRSYDVLLFPMEDYKRVLNDFRSHIESRFLNEERDQALRTFDCIRESFLLGEARQNIWPHDLFIASITAIPQLRDIPNHIIRDLVTFDFI